MSTEENMRYNPNAELAKELQSKYFNLFIKWFYENCVLFDTESVLWKKQLIDRGSANEYSLCHRNSLINCIKNDLEMYCGLAIQSYGGKYILEVVHSFNVENNIVYDFTYYEHREKMLQTTEIILPCRYKGLEISKTFIKCVVSEIIEPKFGNIDNPQLFNLPLQVPYYLFCSGINDWKRYFQKILNEFKFP